MNRSKRFGDKEYKCILGYIFIAISLPLIATNNVSESWNNFLAPFKKVHPVVEVSWALGFPMSTWSQLWPLYTALNIYRWIKNYKNSTYTVGLKMIKNNYCYTTFLKIRWVIQLQFKFSLLVLFSWSSLYNYVIMEDGNSHKEAKWLCMFT